MSSGFFLLFLALILSSCTSRLTNSNEAIAVDCQIHRDAARRSYLQVLDTAGHPLHPDQVSNLTTEFLNARGFLSHPRLTAGACVELPDEAGQLAVVDVKSKASLYWVSAGKNPILLKRPLLKPTKLSYDSLCTGENRFANTQLKRDWNVNSDGPLPNVRIRVQARNVHDDRTFPLFQKDFGAELQLPEYWSTAELKEGQYQLEVWQQELINGLETAAKPVSFSAQCPVTVLHHAPTLLGLTDGSITIPVVDADQGLDWNASPGSGSVFVCMEERSTLPQDLTQGQSCEASAACRDPANFKALGPARSVREGIYNVFAFAQDKADNRGVTQCRTMIFSSQAPQFEVRWVKEKWNREGAALDDTIPILKARVASLFHKDIPEARLKEKLECKAEVLLKSTETVSTPRLICTSGRCQNQSLDIYRPCDSEIGIGIQEFWKSPYSQHATIRLKVRATDEANHKREKTRSLIINTDQWQGQALAWPGRGPLSAAQFYEDETGRMIGFAGSEVFRWNEGVTPENITPKDQAGTRSGKALVSRDGSLYYVAADGLQNPVMIWKRGEWVSLHVPTASTPDSEDLDFFIHPQDGFWLRSPLHSYRVSGESVDACPQLPADFNQLTRFSRDEKGVLWAFTLDQVFSQKPNSDWIQLAVPATNTNHRRYVYQVDRYSHLWMIVADPRDDAEGIEDIIRIDGETQQSYPELVKATLRAGTTATDFKLDANGHANVSNFIWSEEQQNWIVHPLLVGIADHVIRGEFWNHRQWVWFTRENNIYFEQAGELKHLPLWIPGTVPFLTEGQDLWTFGMTDINRLVRNPWIERNAELDDMANVIDMWESPDSRPRLCTRTGKVWELQDGGWSLLVNFNSLDDATSLACSENSKGDIFSHSSSAQWILPVGDDHPRKLADSSKSQSPEGFFHDSRGVTWFACLNREGNAAFCSYEAGNLSFHPLEQAFFEEDDGNFCGFEIGEKLYFLGKHFAVLFQGKERQQYSLPDSNIRFPDDTSLAIDDCLSVGSSVLIRTDSRRSFYLWNDQKQVLKKLDAFDSGIAVFTRMVPSHDGNLYLSNDEGQDGSGEPQWLSEKLKRGSIFRLDSAGAITEILAPDLRKQAFDMRTSIPLRFFAGPKGMTWAAALDYSTWNMRLIQFTDP